MGSTAAAGARVYTYDPTKPDNYDINLENYGVPPDVRVENTPADESAGFDRELKTAVDEALQMLEDGLWQDDPDRVAAGNKSGGEDKDAKRGAAARDGRPAPGGMDPPDGSVE